MTTEITQENETKREVELGLTNKAKLISSNNDNEREYCEILENDESINKRYEAYLILFIFYRRKKNITKCIDFYHQYKGVFGERFLIIHFYSIVLKHTNNKIDLNESINTARASLKLLQNNHSGALNNLAEGLCTYIESFNLEKKEIKKFANESLDLADAAIKLEPNYAKFYGTRSRALCLLGELKQAKKDIETAIDKEDSFSSDYSLRISDYNSIKAQIILKKTVNEITIDTKNEIQIISDEMKKTNLEILSFFVVVISFVIGSITLAKGMQLIEAIQLIFVLASSFLMVVAGFTLLFNSRNKVTRFIFSFIVSSLIFVVAIYSPNLFIIQP